MARPAKSAASAKASSAHYTKAQIKQRAAGEAALSTHSAFTERPEVARNPVAHAEFTRLSQLMGSIGKNDAIYETVINRYCSILAECFDFEIKRENACRVADKIETLLDNMEDCDSDALRRITNDITRLYKTALDLDRQVESKRKMLLSIEKENIMTVAAALRSVPKAPEKKESPLLKALNGDED